MSVTTQSTTPATLPSGTVLATVDTGGGVLAGVTALTGAIPAGTNVIGHVIVDTAPTTAVTGPLTDVQLRATAVPVSGTFFQATQPVSIAAAVPVTDNGSSLTVDGTVGISGTVPVSGTFWQSTQPVSLASVPSHAVTNAGTFAVQVTSAPTTAVTGTFWQATQPVSAASLPLPTGAATEATLSALLSASGGSTATFRGRANTFRTPGRAGTAGQKIFALHNATGSTKVVTINQIAVDLVCTVVKAVTVLPPVIRIHRFTAIPTNGTSLSKTARDSSLSSNANITAWGDASADGTSSATALTVTIPANSMLTQEFAPRLITAAGYEMFDRTVLIEDALVTLRALEGVVVFLDYTLATQNPTTDMWIVSCDWDEA